MADVKLTQIPAIGILETGSLAYIVDSTQSYKGTIDQLATKIINSYNVFSSPLSASLMTAANAEVLLEGLNSASVAVLDADRVDLSNLYFDVDGGSLFDTYVNTATFDGGTF
jgi:hypothetical protein